MSIEVPEADSFVCRLGGEKNHVEAKLRRDFADFADTDAQHGSCDAGREREREREVYKKGSRLQTVHAQFGSWRNGSFGACGGACIRGRGGSCLKGLPFESWQAAPLVSLAVSESVDTSCTCTQVTNRQAFTHAFTGS